jgi:hypothetical protein
VRFVLIAALVVLVAADAWVAAGLVNLAFFDDWDGDRYDAVYWGALAVRAATLAVFCWVTWRLWNRLRATFASRFRQDPA